jgi:guanylate kinase
MERLPGLVFSVSHTTRAPRGQERDGIDYHFIDHAGFQALIDGDEMLEWAEVHGHRYGTHRATTEALLSGGQDVLFDIDVQGGRQIATRMPDAALLFVLPPTMEVLRQRLTGRGSDSVEQVERRMRAAAAEIAAANFYHYRLVNDDLERAVETLRCILVAERHLGVRTRSRA